MKKGVNKDKIVQAAAKLFREKGYRATTMRDLAQSIGIEAASLYNHISSKQELLRTICDDLAREHLNSLDSITKSDEVIIRKIEMLLEAHITINMKMSEMAAVAQDEWRHLDEASREHFLVIRNNYENVLKNWIVSGMDTGEIPKNNPDIVLFTILSSLQWLHHWYRQEREVSENEIRSSMISTLIHGLKH